MCLAQGPQRSDASEARTHNPSVSSQTLYHWATALPIIFLLISLNKCLGIQKNHLIKHMFGYSKEPYQWDGTFEYSQHVLVEK